MKKTLFTAAVLFLVINLFSQEKDFSLAKSGTKVLGVYIFIGCEPANEYDYIATIDVRWHEGDPSKSFLEIIERGKKKYPNFNALIFKNLKFETADLVKFKDLEISGGGFRVGNNAAYNDGGDPMYGQIMQLDNTKQKAGFKYFDEYGDEKLINISYLKLTMISTEQYDKFIEQQNKEIQKHKFTNGEKVSWTDGKDFVYGEVVSLNTKSHKATVKSLNKFGEEKSIDIDFLEVNKMEDSKFQIARKKELEEIKKHQYEVGQKVSFIDGKTSKCGEIVNLNNKNHTATIKYLGVFAEDKTSEEENFEVEKISEEKFTAEVTKYKQEAKKYKFVVGENVIWTKENLFGAKSEPIKAEIIALNDLEHKATIKYINKDNAEKQETASYLTFSKLK